MEKIKMMFTKNNKVSTMSRSYTAFTLAEVLITLGIIGIVAALTIPTLMQKAFDAEAVSKAKETYSILSQAWEQWLTDSNCSDSYSACMNYRSVILAQGGWWPAYLLQDLQPYFKGAQMYVTPSDATLNSLNWLPSTASTYNGNMADATGTPNVKIMKHNFSAVYNTGGVFMLPNGVDVALIPVFGSTYSFYFVFDINGGRNPNRIGKDQFIMTILPSGKISPYYYCYHGGFSSEPIVDGMCNSAANDCNPIDGYSPLATVLTSGKLPDPTSLGYPSMP
jgi:type II secretory pathway pseudopilin PulG